MRIQEEFQVHDTLNPRLWDTTTNILLPEVRERIILICNAFEQYIDVPIEILDIQLVGSNASYNYTDKSDLDVHIMANFELLGENDVILKAYYEAKKSQFNKEMNIKIKGVEIEIYVQDIRSITASNGIYSVCDNAWIKQPKPIKSITKHNTEKEVGKWITKIQQVIDSGDYDKINKAICSLYLMRTNSIAVDGEYGKGNQIFKDIRAKGYLQKLKDELKKAMSKNLSLESMSAGQIVNSDID